VPRINLAPGKEQERAKSARGPRFQVERPSWLPTSPTFLAGLGAMVLLLVAVFLYFGEKRALAETTDAITEAEADSARYQGIVARVRALETVQARLASRVEVMEQVVEGRFFWIDLMETLSLALPEYTWIEKVDQEELVGDQIRIAGGTFANAAVTDYMRGLESSGHLGGISLVGVSRVDKDDAQYQAFTLIATFEGFRATVIAAPDTTEAE
jgi:Tfp pilus assembly protein PilN